MGFDPKRLQNMEKETDEELYRLTVNWLPHTEQHTMAQMEIKRRQDRRSNIRFWLGLSVGVLSMLEGVAVAWYFS